MAEAVKLSAVEHLKLASHGLRGRLADELAEGGIQVSEDAYNLLKFHGSYEQFDRDTSTPRKQAGLEKEYQFMLRVRMPGGQMTAAQYLGLDRLADDRANRANELIASAGTTPCPRSSASSAARSSPRRLVSSTSCCGVITGSRIRTDGTGTPSHHSPSPCSCQPSSSGTRSGATARTGSISPP